MDIVKSIKGSPELNLVIEKIGDEYELLEYLGGGGFSHVYLIRHKLLGKKRALKIMDFSGILNDLKKAKVQDIHHELKRIKKRFINEAKHYDNIDHPNIAKIYNVGVITSQSDDIEVPYLIMQYFDGKNLEELINEAKDPFMLERIVLISKDILMALEALHIRGIIHRDIKPENIIIEKGSGKAILIDFGLAKDMIYGTKLTINLTTMGTPEYMSPEQFTDNSQVGPETDIYAFGVLLYQMATGTLPYHGNFYELMKKHCEAPFPDIIDKHPPISSELNAIIKKSMEKKPEERYRTPKELLDAIESLESFEKKSIRRQKPPKYAPEKKSPAKNKKRWIALVTLTIIMIIAAFLYKDQLKEIIGLHGFIENTDGKEVTKSKLTEEDDRAYESALTENTIDAYEGYVNKYPSGRHTDEAKTRLKKLMENLSFVIQNGHIGVILVVKYSPDGKYVISVGGIKGYINIKLWDSSSFKLIRSFSGQRHFISSISFSPDGKYIVTGSWDKTINLWELKTATKVKTFKGHSKEINSVDFSPLGKFVISGSKDKTIKLWNVESGDEIKTFRCPAGITSVKFTPDGKYILSNGGGKNKLLLLNIESGEKVRIFRGHSDSIRSVDISQNGKYALSGSSDKTIKLWNLNSAKEIITFKGHTDKIYCVKFSPNGKYALSGSADRTLKLWEIKTGKEIRTFTGHSEAVYSVEFSPDGKYIISGSFDETVKLWDVENKKEIKTIDRAISLSYSITFSKSGKYAFTVDKKDTIILWDIESGRVSRSIKMNADDVYPIVFTADERYFLLKSDDKTIKIKEIETGKVIQTLKGNSDSFISSGDVSPDGKYAISGNYKGTIILWDIESGKVIQTFKEHSECINSVVFSPNGKLVLSGSSDKTIILWDIEKRKEIRTFKGHSQGVKEVVFSPDGIHAFSCCSDKIMFWDIRTGSEIKKIKLNSSGADSIAFSSNGKEVLSGDGDKIQLWDIKTGEIIKIFECHELYVNAIGFIMDEKYIISGYVSGSIILWETESGKEVARFVSFRDGEWAAVTSEGYYNCSPNGEQYLNVEKGDRCLTLLLFSRKFVAYYRHEASTAYL